MEKEEQKVQNNPKNKKFRRGLLIFVGFLTILYATFSAGYLLAKGGVKTNIVPGILVNKDVNKPENIDFSLFWQVWNKAHSEFVGKADDQKMVYGAIAGAISALGDPYTMFLDPEMNKQFNEEITGQFEGIGAELSLKNNQLTIISPIDGSPAAKAGLLAGDVIQSIDGKTTDGMTVDQAVTLIRGAKGTQVALQILRGTTSKEYKITRDTINVKSVTFKYQTVSNKKVAVVKISQFGEDTPGLMTDFANDCIKTGCQNIIIDLRNDPGGYLESAIDVASLFVKDGVIVKEVDKSGATQVENSTGSGLLVGKKVIVLLNAGSASASEILAGALSDHGVATTLGEKSFGKGSVQSVEDMPGGSALKVTIAKWLTPNGSAIDGVGITPNIVVPLTEADAAAGRDPQLDRALQEIVK